MINDSDNSPRRLSTKAKDIWMYSVGSLVVLIGWIITVVGLFLEPQGQIHSSVLVALGQALAWSAAIFGIPYYVKNEFGEFKSSIIKLLKKSQQDDQK